MTYLEYKNAFIEKHNNVDWRIETSPMSDSEQYVKTYIFDDGACLTEINRPIFRKAEVSDTIEGMEVTTNKVVKMKETEAWNSDDARIYRFYELW